MIKMLTIKQSALWDKSVRGFHDYDIYWLNGYAKAFELHGDGEPLLICYEGKNTKGINVVMKRDIALDDRFKGKIEKNRYFDLASPYGYGGWLVEGDDYDSLFKEYDLWAKEQSVITEFVRFHPIIQNHKQCLNYYDISELGEVVHIDLSSPEYIWHNLTSKNRNVIRKAQKNGIHIYNGRFPEIFDVFREIYNSTMDRNEAEKYYYFEEDFYKSILDDLPYNAQIFYAEKDNRVIAAAVFLATNERVNYHLSGSLKEFNNLAPMNLLLYEVALWGNANGYKTLYLGGGVGTAEDSLFKFKRAFYRGKLNKFYVGKKVFNTDIHQRLVLLRGETINKIGFFPTYRG